MRWGDRNHEAFVCTAGPSATVGYCKDTPRLSVPVEIGNLLFCLFDLPSVQSIVDEVCPSGLAGRNKEI